MFTNHTFLFIIKQEIHQKKVSSIENKWHFNYSFVHCTIGIQGTIKSFKNNGILISMKNIHQLTWWKFYHVKEQVILNTWEEFGK